MTSPDSAPRATPPAATDNATSLAPQHRAVLKAAAQVVLAARGEDSLSSEMSQRIAQLEQALLRAHRESAATAPACPAQRSDGRRRHLRVV